MLLREERDVDVTRWMESGGSPDVIKKSIAIRVERWNENEAGCLEIAISPLSSRLILRVMLKLMYLLIDLLEDHNL